MKVLLLKNVDKLGKKFDVKEVSDGFARNFLFPENKAKKLTAKDLKNLDEWREQETKKAEEALVEAQKIVSKMDGLEVVVKAKAGEEGQLYGGVNRQKIVDALKEKGFDIKKDFIKMDEAIKEIGEHEVFLDMEHGLEASIKVIVEAE